MTPKPRRMERVAWTGRPTAAEMASKPHPAQANLKLCMARHGKRSSKMAAGSCAPAVLVCLPSTTQPKIRLKRLARRAHTTCPSPSCPQAACSLSLPCPGPSKHTHRTLTFIDGPASNCKGLKGGGSSTLKCAIQLDAVEDGPGLVEAGLLNKGGQLALIIVALSWAWQAAQQAHVGTHNSWCGPHSWLVEQAAIGAGGERGGQCRVQG